MWSFSLYLNISVINSLEQWFLNLGVKPHTILKVLLPSSSRFCLDLGSGHLFFNKLCGWFDCMTELKNPFLWKVIYILNTDLPLYVCPELWILILPFEALCCCIQSLFRYFICSFNTLFFYWVLCATDFSIGIC